MFYLSPLFLFANVAGRCNCMVFVLQRPGRCWLQPVGSSIQSCSVHSLSLVEQITLRPWPLWQSPILPIFHRLQIAKSCSAQTSYPLAHLATNTRIGAWKAKKSSQWLQLQCCNVHFLASSHIPAGRQKSGTLPWSTRDKSGMLEPLGELI